MKTILSYLNILTVLSVITFSCQKEVSFETGNPSTSAGSLQANGTGGCLGARILGTYKKDTALNSTNYVEVNVQVDTIGTYLITTDTVNGYSFKATGTFSSTGVQLVRLAGSGKPISGGTNVFTVRYDGTTCDFSVTVIGAAGGGGTSVVTFNCATSVANGTYKAGTPLTTTNTISLSVNVTTVGTWNITTATVNGMTFSGSGTFISSGNQTITLNGSGTPVAAGTSNIVVTMGTATCTIPITVAPASGGTAVVTFNCATSVANGTYKVGTPLTTTNTISLSVNVTTIGTWSITTATVNGMTFSGSGTFSATGNQTITLNGTGTPVAAGTSNIVVTLGTATCTIPITVVPATGGTAVVTFNCASSMANGTYQAGTPLTTSNTITLSVNVTTIGTWSITTTAVNGMTFSGSGSFTATGNQTITLNGTGTPVTAGTSNIVVTFGTATCTIPVTVAAAPALIDYFPRTTFSNWSYEFDDVPTDSVLIKVIADSITVGGNNYKTFMATLDASMGFDTLDYFRKSGSDYFRYTNLEFYLGFDTPYYTAFNFLKDNQAAGFTWTTPAYSGTIAGTAISVRIKFTILQKDVPVTVNGTTFQNTIVVEEKYEIDLGGGWQDGTPIYGYYKDYYARNIGWILDEVFDDTGMPAGKMELRRHVIY